MDGRSNEATKRESSAAGAGASSGSGTISPSKSSVGYSVAEKKQGQHESDHISVVILAAKLNGVPPELKLHSKASDSDPITACWFEHKRARGQDLVFNKRFAPQRNADDTKKDETHKEKLQREAQRVLSPKNYGLLKYFGNSVEKAAATVPFHSFLADKSSLKDHVHTITADPSDCHTSTYVEGGKNDEDQKLYRAITVDRLSVYSREPREGNPVLLGYIAGPFTLVYLFTAEGMQLQSLETSSMNIAQIFIGGVSLTPTAKLFEQEIVESSRRCATDDATALEKCVGHSLSECGKLPAPNAERVATDALRGHLRSVQTFLAAAVATNENLSEIRDAKANAIKEMLDAIIKFLQLSEVSSFAKTSVSHKLIKSQEFLALAKHFPDVLKAIAECNLLQGIYKQSSLAELRRISKEVKAEIDLAQGDGTGDDLTMQLIREGAKAKLPELLLEESILDPILREREEREAEELARKQAEEEQQRQKEAEELARQQAEELQRQKEVEELEKRKAEEQENEKHRQQAEELTRKPEEESRQESGTSVPEKEVTIEDIEEVAREREELQVWLTLLSDKVIDKNYPRRKELDETVEAGTRSIADHIQQRVEKNVLNELQRIRETDEVKYNLDAVAKIKDAEDSIRIICETCTNFMRLHYQNVNIMKTHQLMQSAIIKVLNGLREVSFFEKWIQPIILGITKRFSSSAQQAERTSKDVAARILLGTKIEPTFFKRKLTLVGEHGKIPVRRRRVG